MPCFVLHGRWSSALTYTKGCDTIYRVLEDVTKTLSKTRRWVALKSAEKLTGAHGCNVERGLVKIDGRNRPNVQRDAETLAAVQRRVRNCHGHGLPYSSVKNTTRGGGGDFRNGKCGSQR